MTIGKEKSFIARVNDAVSLLPTGEAKLAEALRNIPGQLASYTATELAQIAGVSNATVTRFVRRIGYASFEEARQAIRAEQTSGAVLFRVNAGADTSSGRLTQHIEQSFQNIEHSLRGFSDEISQDLVAKIVSAPRLWLIGFRAGQPFARYLGWQVLQVRSDVATLPRDGETLAESIAAIEPDDCVVLFALRRAPQTLKALPDLLAATKAHVAIVGDVADLTAMPARWHLPCQTAAAGPLFNHVGVMAVCSFLASAAIEEAGEKGRRRLRAIEDLHVSLNEF